MKHAFGLLILIVLATAAFAVGQNFFSREFVAGVLEHFGQETVTRVLAWEDMLKQNAGLTERTRIEQVNDFFNHMASVSDMDNWGQRDYWATPVELLAANGGDCEDLAIAKYFSLRMLDVAEDRLRLTYVRAYAGGGSLTIVPHMVLTYYAEPDADPLILDNLIPEIRPASRRRDLVPTYSFNASGLWQARERSLGKRIGDTSRLLKWQDLLKRMQP
jgi:predicted transglutaminase-like cysteine proteinase